MWHGMIRISAVNERKLNSCSSTSYILTACTRFYKVDLSDDSKLVQKKIFLICKLISGTLYRKQKVSITQKTQFISSTIKRRYGDFCIIGAVQSLKQRLLKISTFIFLKISILWKPWRHLTVITKKGGKGLNRTITFKIISFTDF